ncbi:MAG: hypothetical protein ACRCU5_13475 [Rhizobiaceae bacterium]
MDWTLAITRNRDALSRIVAALFAMISAATASTPQGATSFTLPRHIYAAILGVLRSAESALRRLITIAANSRKFSGGLLNSANRPDSNPPFWQGFSKLSPNHPRFRLFDPLKQSDDEEDNGQSMDSFDSFSDYEASITQSTERDEPVNADHLFARLRALRHALKTIPSQARRLARWQLKREAALKTGQPTRVTTLRPGPPPGWRQRPVHEVDTVLRECHRLVRDLMNST